MFVPLWSQRGNSSVGRARPCQGRGREFESRFPLKKALRYIRSAFFVCLFRYICGDMKLIRKNMAQIIALCEKHKVLQLYVFGSILTDKFNKDSDVDFTVIFDRNALPLLVYGENYFDFKFALEDLLKRDVDLVEYNAIKNPYFKEELDETKQLIYGQAS